MSSEDRGIDPVQAGADQDLLAELDERLAQDRRAQDRQVIQEHRVPLPEVTYQLPPNMVQADATQFMDLYDSIISNLHFEARDAGRQMTTFEQLLLERVAFMYVYVRYAEAQGEFNGALQHRQANQFWLEMSKEFETRVKPTDVQRFSRTIQKAFTRALDAIEDPVTRAQVGDIFGAGLEEAGL
jgi:hypothetical protein